MEISGEKLIAIYTAGLDLPWSIKQQLDSIKNNRTILETELKRLVGKLPKILSPSFVLFGTCQSGIYRQVIEELTSTRTLFVHSNPENISRIMNGEFTIMKDLLDANYIIIEEAIKLPQLNALMSALKLDSKIRHLPSIHYPVFHPDMDYVSLPSGERLQSPTEDYHSRIIFSAFKEGLTQEQTLRLFDRNIFKHAGYFDIRNKVTPWLIRTNGRQRQYLPRILHKWESRKICFMHTINHPKPEFMIDVVRDFFVTNAIPFDDRPCLHIKDSFASGTVWDVYPDIAKKYSDRGSYNFLPPAVGSHLNRTNLTLSAFIRSSYECYSKSDIENADTLYMSSARICQNLRSIDKVKATSISTPSSTVFKKYILRSGSNPYQKLEPFRYWRHCQRSKWPFFGDGPNPKVTINKGDKVVTAGSCFAQHLAKFLTENTSHAIQYESATQYESETENKLLEPNHGPATGYSARYGNIYTPRHMLQLLEQSLGLRSPLDAAWIRKDGKLCDPFRPTEFPLGFSTLEELLIERKRHLSRVRAMFADLDVLVFTLGLSEAWQSRIDGSVFPTSPGVVAGGYSPSFYEWRNFTSEEIAQDLAHFFDLLQTINTKARLIITVSPVPLVATYDQVDAVTANQSSKAQLRAAAKKFTDAYSNVDYFYSYEMVVGMPDSGSNFLDDGRSVSPDCVKHVLSIFSQRYLSNTKDHVSPKETFKSDPIDLKLDLLNQIICDELIVQDQYFRDEHTR
jgi:hypothetical protein